MFARDARNGCAAHAAHAAPAGACGGARRWRRRCASPGRRSACHDGARTSPVAPTLGRIAALLFGLFASSAQAQAPRLPLFDAHLHYNAQAQATHPIERVPGRLREAGVAAVLVSSVPNDGTRALVVAAARAGGPRVVPFIRPYRHDGDRSTWFDDPATVALIESELARPIDWRGIGEFHLHGRDVDTPSLRRIVALAASRGLWLHAHCDDAALEVLLAIDPAARIIWAHTGFSTPPGKVAAYLARHPNLVGELSYRHGVTLDGRLTPEWRALFLRFPDRFLVGSDTWTSTRWSQYGEIMAQYRAWLAELPGEVAEAIAYRNGERMFGR